MVVGAGISGAACARALLAAGLDVRVLDRGRRVGGRMASRRLDDRPVDLGASYLTASGDDFTAVVRDWESRGLARPWTETFTVLSDDAGPEDKDGPLRWGAAGGLRSLVEDLLDGVHVESREVASLDELDALEPPAVVLAMPDAQARRLLPADHPVAARLDREFEPVLALAASYDERTWDVVSPGGRFDGAFVNGDDVLAWIADDGRRRGDDAPVLVTHSTPEFAAGHLEDPQAAGPAMTEALRSVLGLGEPASTHVHRWSLARPTGEREDTHLLEDTPTGLLGVCGDGWGKSPKVETAWKSGHELGRALVSWLQSNGG
ncbi:NAD(P)/FAD-dependent oxidoreductase [Nocardioides flavescens]|uniref:NAD(P)/FAD-dependent oxidoreductase n=1 Tax=Nocardioides flavescens TaxID=2691959 RepID=UPI00301DCE38